MSYKPDIVIVLLYQTHGFPGNTESHLNFRTDSNPLKILPEAGHRVVIVFVIAVMPYCFSKQARGYSYANKWGTHDINDMREGDFFGYKNIRTVRALKIIT